jgi:hypothetical protein
MLSVCRHLPLQFFKPDLKELGANLELTCFNTMELADIMLGKDVEFKEYRGGRR